MIARARRRNDGSVLVSLPVGSKSEADWGYDEKRFRDLLVDVDESVLAWDHIAGHYSRLHRLSDEQIAEARRLAAEVQP